MFNTVYLTMACGSKRHMLNVKNINITSSLICRTFSSSESVLPVKMAFTHHQQKGSSVDNSPMIVIHGLFGSRRNWNSIAKAICAKTGKQIFAVDARNHGDSPHVSEMSYRHMAEDIMSLVKDFKIDKVTLLGHSMGGRATMLAALLYPDIVENLIVVDVSPVSMSPNFSSMPKFLDAMKELKFNQDEPLHVVRKHAEEDLLKVVHDRRICQFLLTNLAQSENGEYSWKLNISSISKNMENIVTFPQLEKTYHKPTLFICGANSDYVRQEDHGAIRRLFPSAKFEYVSNASHWVHADNPETFIKLVVSFLSEEI